MDKAKLMIDTFDALDENELTVVLDQLARRMMILRATTPDVAFWYSVLMRVKRWLSVVPVIDDEEKNLLVSPPQTVSGRIRAIRHLRERSGMRLHACMEIIDTFIKDNINQVHDSVRASYLSKHGRADEMEYES